MIGLNWRKKIVIKFHKMKIDFTEIERIDEKNCLEGVGFLD